MHYNTDINIIGSIPDYHLIYKALPLLLTWFEPCEREKANVFLNASQIAAKLAEKAKINITDGTINKLGKALKKHNFIRLKKNGIAVYALIENTWEDVDNRNKVVEE